MPKKKKSESVDKKKASAAASNVRGLKGQTISQPITETLEVNYMPYAMSVIVSRAIPEIDGFKPSHRKLLYTMYKMGLLRGPRTKSANIVGQTMHLNPHGDAAIYDTMVRLSRGYEALLHPFVDSKGNFGKAYSRDMSYAASRYTEAKLEKICEELFRDIDSDTVDFQDNYDATMKEPVLLPTTFPNILVSANNGIAVGMASNICGFNLREVCAAAIARMQDPECDLLEIMPAPDFPSGGELLYDESALREIYNTGRGSVRVRARWRYVKKENLIEIYEIPYTTTTEAILGKVSELIKAGKIREISDMRDETDLSGLRLTIDLKRGVDPDRLMAKLMRLTPLEDSFACNFNVLIGGFPKVMGVGEILDEWTAWRTECVRRRVFYQLGKKKEKYHLLEGLSKILLDIDRAIRIIRETEREDEVVPNLMIGFSIDEQQAEYIAEIKLRNINRQYILNRTKETESLAKEIADLEKTLESKRRIRGIIQSELKAVSKNYGQDRKTQIVTEYSLEEAQKEEVEEVSPVSVFVSHSGYLKKITPQSLRMSGQQKFKEGDSLAFSADTNTAADILFFTDRCRAYKAAVGDFPDSKASALGVYLPSEMGFEEGESLTATVLPGDWEGWLLLCFRDGKLAKIPLSAWKTKSNRHRLTGAYSDKEQLVSAILLKEDADIVLYTSAGKALIVSTAQISPKATRTSAGVQGIRLRGNAVLTQAVPLSETPIKNISRYRARNLPAAGASLQPSDAGEEQLTIS